MDTASYYTHWETVSAYRIKKSVLENWLRELFSDNQITVLLNDDDKYGFWLIRPLSTEEKKWIRVELPKVVSL